MSHLWFENLDMTGEHASWRKSLHALPEHHVPIEQTDLDLAKFWFAWACLKPKPVVRDGYYAYKRPRLNDGSFAAFLEWRWALFALPPRIYRVDYSYEDEGANRALVIARRVEPAKIESSTGMSVEEIARTLKRWQEVAVNDLRHFHNSVEIVPLMTLFRSSWVVSTQCLAREAGFSKATASRILHLLEALGVLRRGTVRGHAVYSLTDSLDGARLLAERVSGSLPRVTGVYFS